MYQPATSPSTIGGVLDSGFRLFRESFGQVFVLAIVTALVAAPLGLFSDSLRDQQPGGVSALTVIVVLVSFIAVVLITSGAIIARIDAVSIGRSLALGEALRIGVRRAPPMLACFLLVGIAVTCGFMLLVIPGLIVLVYVLFAPYLVITNELGPIASITQSFRLVRGHWWRTAALITIVGIIVGVLYFILALVLGIAVVSDPEQIAVTSRLPWYIEFIVSPLLSAVATPLGYAMLLALLQDLQLRHRGDDLAARIATA